MSWHKTRRLRWFRKEDGEPRIWTYSINESARKGPGALPRHFRWWLHWPGNELGVEWTMFPSRTFHWDITFDATGDDDMKITFSIPFVITFWIMLHRCKPVLRLLGLTWAQVREKPSRDWKRELGLAWHHGALWVKPWVNDDEWNRRSFSIHPIEILLGRSKYREYDEQTVDHAIAMPEGYYPATVRLYTAEWKRPRWPFAKRMYRAEVNIEGGVPVPGKGENSWDMDDDAIFSMTAPSNSAAEAAARVYESAMRDRMRYARPDWTPDKGWPVHLRQSEY